MYQYINVSYNAITFTLPTEQQAMAGNFASDVCAAYAMTEQGESDMRFSFLCGFVKFSLSGDAVADLASVRFEAAGQVLSGTLNYSIYWDYSFYNTAPASHVTLKGHFKKEVDYYMVVVPCSLDGGFSFTFTKEDGSVYVKEGTIENGKIDCGRIGNFGEIDLSGAVFAKPSETDITDMAFIKAVEARSTPKIELTRNTAGYVSLTDDNKELMASVTKLDLFGKGLTDASALKYFTGLQTLDCSGNNLEELDVSGLKSLTELNCKNSNVMILTVNGATALETLLCSWNSLTKLDVSELKNLTYLNCVSNIKLMELTVTGATALETLDCSANRLTELNVSGLTNLIYLDCYYNQLTELDVSGLTKLTSLTCSNNQLTTLTVTGATALKSLSCYYNQLTELEVGSLTNLTSLTCSNNQLTTLDVSELTNLTSLACFGNRLTTLDISALRQLMYIFCGKQTSDGTTQQTLTLTLTAAQRDGVWKSSLAYDSEYNEPVDLNVQQ